MKKLLIAASLAAMMSVSAPAAAFNPIEWVLGYLVKDAAEDAVKDAVVESVTGGGKKTAGTPKAHVATAKVDKPWRALPLTGEYRFAMPKDLDMENLPVGPRGGYLDRFGNEWVPVLNSRKNRIVGWEEHLSDIGALRLGWMARDGRLNLTVDGKFVKPDGGKK